VNVKQQIKTFLAGAEFFYCYFGTIPPECFEADDEV